MRSSYRRLSSALSLPVFPVLLRPICFVKISIPSQYQFHKILPLGVRLPLYDHQERQPKQPYEYCLNDQRQSVHAHSTGLSHLRLALCTTFLHFQYLQYHLCFIKEIIKKKKKEKKNS